jgi:hypothetical protein
VTCSVTTGIKAQIFQEEELMSQRQQLRLVFSNSPNSSKLRKLSSVKCKRSRAPSSVSSFQLKVALLEEIKPAAARLIEQLVDDALGNEHRMVAPPWAPLE